MTAISRVKEIAERYCYNLDDTYDSAISMDVLRRMLVEAFTAGLEQQYDYDHE